MNVSVVLKMQDDYDVIVQLASTKKLELDYMFTHPENGNKQETLSGDEKRFACATRPNTKSRLFGVMPDLDNHPSKYHVLSHLCQQLLQL